MSKIELYIVLSSRGSYDGYHETLEPIIYATLEAAEKRKQEVIDKNQAKEFPIKWCTEEEFDELIYSIDADKNLSETDLEDYYNWLEKKEFNTAWVKKLELDMQSWRDKQLKKLWK